MTDGDRRLGLCILRSLAKKNVATSVLTSSNTPLSSFSRYRGDEILCTSPAEDSQAFLLRISRLLKKKKYDVVFPIQDTSLVILSEHRDQVIPHSRLLLPSHESVRSVFDKSLTIRLAHEEGIPTPETFLVRNITELRDAASKVTYPVVIKPKWSWMWSQDKAFHRRAGYANSPSELVSSYKVIHRDFPFPMIQEYVPGVNIDIGVIVDNSEPKALCCIKEHRMLPVTGGNAVFRETIQPDPEIVKYAFRLLRRLKWHGVAEVEFRIDERDLTPKLMEINGRFWASLQLAINSGVDFPYLLYRLAIDGKIQPALSYRAGVKERWINGDVFNLLGVLKGEPRISAARPGRLRTLLHFLKFYEANLHYDNFSVSDPMPFFMSIYRDVCERLPHGGHAATMDEPR